ncbi:MAG: MarC family protein [Candidatus Hadarchaeales archaeon]
MIGEFLKIFISIFVIMDPFASLPLFMILTKGKNVKKSALYAIGVASLVLFTFLFLGEYIFTIFGVKFYSFKVAGGVLLFILSAETILGIEPVKRKKHGPELVLIGTPMLTGPGVMATTVIFSQETGYLVTSLASLAALFLSFLILVLSKEIARLLGETGVEIASRVIGVLLGAIAIEFIASGIKEAIVTLG